jgi:hypothetical protein
MSYYHEIVPAQMFPKLDSLISLYVDKQSSLAWLEFHSTPHLIGRGMDGGQVCRVLIGAVRQGGSWREIRPSDLPGGSRLPIILDDPELTFKFQKAIVDEWRTFNSQTASQFTKGWSSRAGLKSITSANFIVKALKTGYEAIGQYSHFGSKFTAWSIRDLLIFMSTQKRVVVAPPGLAAFDAVVPNPFYDAITYQFEGNLAKNRDERKIDLIPFAGTRTNYTYATDLSYLPSDFKRCVSYGFRGDTRDPVAIQQSRFTPNATRPTHVAQGLKPGLVQRFGNEPMNLERFLADQHHGEFISTSKSVAIARFFATSTWTPGGAQVPRSTDGWIYACFVEGAIEIPTAKTYKDQNGDDFTVLFNEQELAMPGMLDWDDVMACRKVQKDGKFTGPVYVRPHLEDGVHHSAAPIIYDLLSGKSQGKEAFGGMFV